MAAQKGSEFLVRVGDGGSPTETFTVIGGFRTSSFTINGEMVDITHKGSGGVRHLLEGAGVTSFSASGSGVFIDDAAFATVEGHARLNTHANYQIVIPGWGVYEGPFQITSASMDGEYNGEVVDNFSLESAGPVSFTAAV